MQTHTCLWLMFPHSLHTMLFTIVPWYNCWMKELPLVPTRECSRALNRILLSSCTSCWLVPYGKSNKTLCQNWIQFITYERVGVQSRDSMLSCSHYHRTGKRKTSLIPTKETDLTAVPAKTVSEISGGGTLVVHQQQGGKQSLQLQWDDSDLQRYMEMHLLLLQISIGFHIWCNNVQYRNLPWPLACPCLSDILTLVAPT